MTVYMAFFTVGMVGTFGGLVQAARVSHTESSRSQASARAAMRSGANHHSISPALSHPSGQEGRGSSINCASSWQLSKSAESGQSHIHLSSRFAATSSYLSSAMSVNGLPIAETILSQACTLEEAKKNES